MPPMDAEDEFDSSYEPSTGSQIDENYIDDDETDEEFEYTIDARELAAAMENTNANGGQRDDDGTSLRDILNGESTPLPACAIPYTHSS